MAAGCLGEGSLTPLVCRETIAELLRVLAYPKFQLGRAEIDELLGDFLPVEEIADVKDEDQPDYRDPQDRIFLALARQAGTDALVTGDGNLLKLRGSFPMRILTSAEFKS